MSKAAGIFFTDGKKVLLLKREPNSTYPNTWSIPGGGLKLGETPEEGARRECQEEAGSCQGTKFGVKNFGNWTTFFYKVPKPFKVTLSDEHTAYKWCSLEELHKIKLCSLFAEDLPVSFEIVKKVR